MKFTNPADIELEVWETGFNLDYHRYVRDASPIHINVPKLMPFIPIAPSKLTNHMLNTSMIQNASTCRPRIKGSISESNYIVSPRHHTQTYNDEVFHGAKLSCFIPNKNPKRIEYVTM